MPSNVTHACMSKTKAGILCRRRCRSEDGTDPDGLFRCAMHTQDPKRAAHRRATCESDENRREGAQGKARHVETFRAVAAHRRAAGVGPAPGERWGGKGLKLPEGVKVPKKGQKLAIPDEILPEGAEKEAKEDAKAALLACDLTTELGRAKARKENARLMLSGVIGPSEGAVMHQMIQGAQKDGGGANSKRTVAVRFATIETRQQAEAYREAQLIKEGLSDVEGVPT